MIEISHLIAGILLTAFVAFVAYKVSQPKVPTGGSSDEEGNSKDRDR